MLQTCYCNGCIEDCDYCHGTGFREVRLARPAWGTMHTSSPPGGHESRRCAFCGEWSTNLERHTAEKHRGHRPAAWRPEPRETREPRTPAARPKIAVPRIAAARLPAPAAPAAREKPRGGRCPECEQRVPGLVAHLLRDHGWRTVDGVLSQPSGKPRALLLCPDCQSPVRRDRLEAHRRKMHVRRVAARAGAAPPPSCAGTATGRKAGKPAKTQARKPSRRTVAGRKERVYTWDAPFGASLEEMRHERQADATREYAHTFRERGRFGSHAAHDGYGDESDA